MTERPDSPPGGAERPGGSDPQTGFDRDLAVDRVLGFGAGVAMLIAACAVVCWFFLRSTEHRLMSEDPRPSPIPEANQPVLPPAPRLQRDPPADMAALRARENAILRSWGWADEEAAIARIPIDRAIDLMAEKGVHAALEGDAQGEPPSATAPSQPPPRPPGGAP